MLDLTRKRALGTGSTQGIGFAIAKVLSQAGAEEYTLANNGDHNDTQSAL